MAGIMKEIRVLCQKCINDYRKAGYKVFPDITKNKEPCDKCNRMGYICNIKRGGESCQVKS